MTDATASSATDAFLRHHRWIGIGFWVVAVVISAIGNTIRLNLRCGSGAATWRCWP